MRRSFVLGGAGVATALCAVLWALGCGGGTGGGPAARTPQFVLDPVGSASNAGSMTMSIDRSSVDANNADRVDVTATLLDPQRRPLAGRGVIFEASFPDVSFLGGTDVVGSDFPSTTTVTDGNGVARVTVKAGGTAGRMAIVASTTNVNLNLGGAIFLNLTDVGFISGNLQVLPAEISLEDPTAGLVLEFLITGGQPFRAPEKPYRLQNAETSIGTAELLDDGLFPVVVRYTVSGKQAGAHVFSVVDATGTQATGTVSVTFTALQILPESATLVTGQSQVFTLTGGVPPYTCSPSGGTLSPTTILERGGTTTFTAGAVVVETTFTILCSDAAGQIVSAQVTVGPAPTPVPSGGPTPVPTPTAQTVTTIIVQPNPASVNGVEGGTSNLTATVLDQNNDSVAGVNVLFTLAGQSGEPSPSVPSLSPLTAASDAEGQAVSVLTVPAGTAPQFLSVTASARGVSGQGQVGVTSQRVDPPGPPARLNAAIFKASGFGDNNDGTYVTVFSALVTDAEGNPVADGVEVDWGPISPNTATVLSPTFTNGQPPCDIGPYEDNTGLAVTAQPGTALTCVIYPATLVGLSGSVTVKVADTSLSRTASFVLPGPFVPTPTPEPIPTPTP